MRFVLFSIFPVTGSIIRPPIIIPSASSGLLTHFPLGYIVSSIDKMVPL